MRSTTTLVYIVHTERSGSVNGEIAWIDGVYADEAQARLVREKLARDAIAAGETVFPRFASDPDEGDEGDEWTIDIRLDVHQVRS